jgi:hypothetical protein
VAEVTQRSILETAPVMSQATSTQHPRPWILVAAFLFAVFGPVFSMLLYSQFSGSTLKVATWILEILGFVNLIPGVAFTGIAIWVASRAGAVSKKTFVVPCILTMLAAASPAIPWILQSVNNAYRPTLFMFAQVAWSYSIQLIIHYTVVFMVISRAMGVFLRPAQQLSAPSPLTISLVMGLTGVIACSFAIDLWIVREASNSISFQSTIMSLPSVMISTLLGYATTSLLFFGVVLLFVPTRTSRLAGWLLIGIWILASTASGFWCYLVMMPAIKLEIERLNTSTGTVAFSETPTPLMLIANIAFTAFSTFAVVSLFHLAGYRWDRGRPLRDTVTSRQESLSFADVE